MRGQSSRSDDIEGEPTPKHAMALRGRPTATQSGSLHGAPIPNFFPSTPSSRVSSPPKSPGKSRPSSPSKSTNSHASKVITKREHLAQMQPDVTFCPIDGIKENSVPQETRALWTGYIIPARDEQKVERLQATINTPMKTKVQIPESNYAPRLFQDGEMARLFNTAMDVIQQASLYRGVCHEPHWVSKVVAPLMTELERLSSFASARNRRIETLNISEVLIAPRELCPTSPSGAFADANKKVDYAIALTLSENEKRTLNQGTYCMDGPVSINQATSSFVSIKPMPVCFEVKTDDRDPLIQLGTWNAAEFEKRHREGYPMTVPIPSVAIYGDYWQLSIAFAVVVPAKDRRKDAKPYRVQFLGPIEMGNTCSVDGVFRILHFLKALVKWSFEIYEPVYLMKVLAMANRG
ncbi:MAG: hypothetical protein L6R35_001025 [Caloplaca aegaea]|nr:MAG: hypothetical protein L6R35_001025 [Caloplaca aegaea]